MKDMKIEKNTIASVHYTGTLPESGETFDSSEGRDPLTFLVGHGQMIPGFEAELMGAKVGDKKTFTLSPDKAYGPRDDAAILQIPRAQFAQLEDQTKMYKKKKLYYISEREREVVLTTCELFLRTSR